MIVGTRKRSRGNTRRSRRLWAAALCTASFLAGQAVFGVDAPTLLSKYHQARNELTPAASTMAPERPSASNAPTALKPAVVEAAPSNLSDASEVPSGETPAPRPIPLLAARPLPLNSSSSSAAAAASPRLAPIVDGKAAARPAREKATTQGSGSLPPILSASSIPRPSERAIRPLAPMNNAADLLAPVVEADSLKSPQPLRVPLGRLPKTLAPVELSHQMLPPVIPAVEPESLPEIAFPREAAANKSFNNQPIPPFAPPQDSGLLTAKPPAQAPAVEGRAPSHAMVIQNPTVRQPLRSSPALGPAKPAEIAVELPSKSSSLAMPSVSQSGRAESSIPRPAMQLNKFVVEKSAKPQAEIVARRSAPPAAVRPPLPVFMARGSPKPEVVVASEPADDAADELASSEATEPEATADESLPLEEPLSGEPEASVQPPQAIAVKAPQPAPAALKADPVKTEAAPMAATPYVVQLASEIALPSAPKAAEPSVAIAPVIQAPAAVRQARVLQDRDDSASQVQRTDFTSALGNSAFNLQPAAAEPVETEDAIVEFGGLPEGSPFEAIAQSGTINLRVRRSLLMRTKVDIYRTAVVDDGIVELAQFTPREISLIGRSQGQTHVTFWFDDPNMQPVTYLVEVAVDELAEKKDIEKYKLLESVVNEMFPDSKVYLVLVADKLLVKGQARDSEEAAQIMTIIRAQSGGVGAGAYGYGGLTQGAATPVLSLAATGSNPGPAYTIINMLRVPGVQQVALRVKIAELNRSAARGFGVDIVGQVDITDSSKLFFASLLNASSGGGTSLIASVDGDDLDIGIRYAQQRGVIRLLSEPTLVTLSGRPATFIAGGEFAVPTIVGSVGLNAVTTDFRAFGAIISFLPTVIDKDRIRLQVAPEFSQINSDLSVGGTPGLNVRAATTTVEMREGQTLAIAGLLEDTYKGTTVGDLPYLAQIFGRRDTSRNETELIILVTPELVQAMEPEEVPPLPGFDVTEPNACEFFYHGDIEGNPTRDHRSTVWPRLRKRYGMGGPAMTSGPFGHGQ